MRPPRANFEKHLRRNKSMKDAHVHGWGRQISDVPECGCLLELKLLLTANKTVKDAEDFATNYEKKSYLV